MLTAAVKPLTTCQDEPPLRALALCLSGCEEEESNRALAARFQTLFPGLSRACVVASDTEGALHAVTGAPGVVLIAGTGSNCLLVRADGTRRRCGGWGHVIGDQGSAFWLARAALKTLVEVEEGYSRAWTQEACARVRHVALAHFGVSGLAQLLDPLYNKFDKSHVAALAEPLAHVALEGDALARDLFARAGRHLGRHVGAVVRGEVGHVDVVCVGSVFRSFALLEPGLRRALPEEGPRLALRRLTESAAVGAALLGARATGEHVTFDLRLNSELLMLFND